MFIELPQSPTRSTAFELELDADFDEPQTLTAGGAPRARGAAAASRIRLSSPRDARSWPMHASVDAGLSLELTLTQACQGPATAA